VFSYILGIPAHPLMIHFAIVFLVLLVAGSAVYALVPPLRSRIWWAVAGLAVAGPLAAWFAKMSGEKLFDLLVAQKYPKEVMDQVNVHLDYGTKTLYFSLGLGVATLALVLVSTAVGSRPAAEGETRGSLSALAQRGREAAAAGSTNVVVSIGLALITLVLAGFTGYYVFKTGDTGAHAVWGSFTK
jgi:uncharacterized membrane protein